MDEGLNKVLAEEKPGSGYAELGAGISVQQGPFAFGELGYRLTDNQALFVRGEADREDAGIFAGWKWEF